MKDEIDAAHGGAEGGGIEDGALDEVAIEAGEV